MVAAVKSPYKDVTRMQIGLEAVAQQER